MKYFVLIHLSLSLLSAALVAQAEEDGAFALRSLDAELVRLGTQTALLLPSQEVEGAPVWSPDGARLAANVAGSWYSAHIERISLGEASWRDGLLLGVLQSEESIEEAPDAASWQKESSGEYTGTVRAKSGVSVSLRQVEMSTSFEILRPGVEKETVWTSGFEVCHSPVLSPDEQYVAFICELNGVFVYRLAQSGP